MTWTTQTCRSASFDYLGLARLGGSWVGPLAGSLGRNRPGSPLPVARSTPVGWPANAVPKLGAGPAAGAQGAAGQGQLAAPAVD